MYYPAWKVERFTVPSGTNVSQFFLEDLICKCVGRCDESELDSQHALNQTWKALLEGSDLKVEKKYSEPQTRERISIIAASKSADIKQCTSETEAFKARIVSIKMMKQMKDRISTVYIPGVKQCGSFVWSALLERYDLDIFKRIVGFDTLDIDQAKHTLENVWD